jgi:hypothetical protein
MQKMQISVPHKHRWGDWQFDERRLYLDYLPHNYNAPLPTQNLAGQMFSSLRGVAAKTWGTKQVLLNLTQAYSEIFSCNPKFSKPFQNEIATRKAAWDQFLAEIKALVEEEGVDRPSWNRELEEAFNRFKVG